MKKLILSFALCCPLLSLAQAVNSWESSPYNWKNSEYNYNNSPYNYNNSSQNYNNSQYNYNSNNGVFDGQGNRQGYQVKSPEGVTNWTAVNLGPIPKRVFL